MCDFGQPRHHHPQQDFGFIVDVPEIRSLIDDTQRLTQEIADTPARGEPAGPRVRQ